MFIRSCLYSGRKEGKSLSGEGIASAYEVNDAASHTLGVYVRQATGRVAARTTFRRRGVARGRGASVEAK